MPLNQFIKDNSRWLLVLLFSAGIVYAEFQNLKTVEDRLDKKIKIIKENEDKIHALEVEIAVLKSKIKCKHE